MYKVTRILHVDRNAGHILRLGSAIATRTFTYLDLLTIEKLQNYQICLCTGNSIAKIVRHS